MLQWGRSPCVVVILDGQIASNNDNKLPCGYRRGLVLVSFILFLIPCLVLRCWTDVYANMAKIWQKLASSHHNLTVPTWPVTIKGSDILYCFHSCLHYIYKCLWTHLQISGFNYFSHTRCWKVYQISTQPCDLHRQTLAVEWPYWRVTFNMARS